MALHICKHCGYEGETKKVKRGSGALESALWVLFTPLAPIYWFWRRSGRSKDCPNCERTGFVKSSSDEGWVVKKKFEKELGKTETKQPTPQFESFGRQSSQIEETSKRKVDPDQW